MTPTRTRLSHRAHPRSRGENGVSPVVPTNQRGSSPLTRGKPASGPGFGQRPGLIPAHAGKTRPWRTCRPPCRAHPRSRGENLFASMVIVPSWGSSPLTRGKHDEVAVDGSRGGLIPAHAGKTYRYRQTKRLSGAHPRSRGENRRTSGSSACRSGSSPLTRGKPCGVHIYDLTDGLIPAHAGKTRQDRESYAGSWAHPRSRGENAGNIGSDAGTSGSSPLTRGKPGNWVVGGKAAGLIPAHAGKTTQTPGSPCRRGAHPRSRGENIKAAAAVVAEWGSSPLTRGKPYWPAWVVRMRRLIPAHAGKTLYRAGHQHPARAHPRSRGENV